MATDNKVIAVFSPVGGLGTSTLAVHIAHLLATKAESAIVDFVLDFGTVSEFVGFAPKFRIGQIPIDEITPASSLLNELSLPQRQSLKVFAASDIFPQRFNYKALIQSCRDVFKYTVLDLPHTLLAPEVEAALEEADYIMLVCSYGWETISVTDIFLEDVARDRKHSSWYNKSKVIINKEEWLPKDVLEVCHNQLKAQVFAKIPFDRNFDGQRQLLTSSCPLFDAIRQLVQKIESLK